MTRDELPVGSNVRSLRQARGLTQAELAERVGVSRQTINYIEKGDYAPSVRLALLLADALDTRVDDLFFLLDSPRR